MYDRKKFLRLSCLRENSDAEVIDRDYYFSFFFFLARHSQKNKADTQRDQRTGRKKIHTFLTTERLDYSGILSAFGMGLPHLQDNTRSDIRVVDSFRSGFVRLRRSCCFTAGRGRLLATLWEHDREARSRVGTFR